jgi:hypothetical protein
VIDRLRHSNPVSLAATLLGADISFKARGALILPIHGEMSGSIAGNVFSHNKGGQYVRQRTIPTNPNSTKQQQARSILQTLSAAWRGLSTANQTAWDNYAAANPALNALGATFLRSGHQAYVGLNARLLLAGVARVDTAPVAATPAELTTITPTLTAPTGISIVFAPTPQPAGTRVIAWITLPGSAGKNPNLRQARLVGATAAAAATPAVFVSPFPAAVGQVSNLFVGTMGPDGQISVLQKVRATWA